MGGGCLECALRGCGLFKPVSQDELATINDMKRDHVAVPAGTEIIRAGQDSAELYTLYSGWAFRFKNLPDGRRQILNFLLPGDLVGLQAAMFDVAQHGIEALTEVELCLLPRHKVWELFGKMPELAFDVAWLGAREESHVDENLLSAGRRTAAERIAALIVILYKRADALFGRLGFDFAKSLVQSASVKPGQFFFTAESITHLLEVIRLRLSQQAAQIIRQADKICSYRFDLLGYEDLDFGDPINWHLDPVHEKCSPKRTFYRVPFLDFATVGDSKVIWELNCHQHFVTRQGLPQKTNQSATLTKLKQCSTGTPRIPTRSVSIGPVSLEVAFRSLSWI